MGQCDGKTGEIWGNRGRRGGRGCTQSSSVDWHLSSTRSYIPDLSTYVERGPEVEADDATEDSFYDALDTNTDASVA